MASLQLAIDLGTTNSVVAAVQAGSVRVLSLPGIAREQPVEQAALVPSAIHVQESAPGRWPFLSWRLPWGRRALDVHIGQQALHRNLSGTSPAFAQGFKRALGSQPHRPVLRTAAGALSVRETTALFLRELLAAARAPLGVRRGRVTDDLTIPVPVGFYEPYRAELRDIARRLGVRRFRSLDEPVAAALGYGVNIAREERLLVVDFGGGTLDLAVVRLGPQTAGGGAAPILAKHMVALGGDDVDCWLVERLLMDLSDLPEWQYDARWEAMRVKEQVSKNSGAAVEFCWNGIRRLLDREGLVRLLTERGLYDRLGGALAEIKRQLAESPEPGAPGGVDQVLLVGGSTLLPEVPAVVDAAFPAAVVRHDPAFVFTAVASGAARFAGGIAVDDFIYHDYCLAVQNEQTRAVEYELLVPRHTRYPTSPDFAVRYYADYAGMTEMRFRVCEAGRLGQEPIAWQARSNGGGYWSPRNEEERARVVELNPGDAALPLRPAGEGTSPRLRVTYTINADRWLCATVEDLVRRQPLRVHEPVVRLR